MRFRRCMLLGFSRFHLYQAAPAEKSKDRALSAESHQIVRIDGALKVNGFSVDKNAVLTGEILYIILALSEKKLCMPIGDRFMVQSEITARPFSDFNGQFLK